MREQPLSIHPYQGINQQLNSSNTPYLWQLRTTKRPEELYESLRYTVACSLQDRHLRFEETAVVLECVLWLE